MRDLDRAKFSALPHGVRAFDLGMIVIYPTDRESLSLKRSFRSLTLSESDRFTIETIRLFETIIVTPALLTSCPVK